MTDSTLRPALRKLHRTAEDILTEAKQATGELRKIKEVIKDGVAEIRDAIQESIQAQAELQMMEHVADVEAIKPQIDAEEERLRTEKRELDERLEQIGERYERRHQELDEQAIERVRDLGSHIFEIDENEFEAATEGPFTDHVTSTWATFRSHNSQIQRGRQETIKERTNDVVNSVEEFINQQHDLLEQIENKHIDESPSTGALIPDETESGSIQIPYYEVTLEVDGRIERNFIVPSEIEQTDGPTTYELSPMTGLEQLITRTKMVDVSHERIQAAELAGAAEEYLEDAPPFLSYEDAVKESVDGDVEVLIEGGER